MGTAALPPSASSAPSSTDSPGGARADLRVGGTVQLTVEGRPVYLFAEDSAHGEVTGQGVGGVWYAIAPDGSEVRSVRGSARY